MEAPREIKTTCPYCGVGCGVIAGVAANGAVAVRGDPDHPANVGRLCSKGSALAETIDLDGRLLAPEVYGRETGWDEAVDLVAARFTRAIDEHGPDSVAFYVSGQLLTEDYYVANKLMKGFIGSANIDTNSRLCMASAVAGHRRAFGSDTVPGCYEDLDLADLIVLVGSNLAWCHPVLYQRIAAEKERRPDLKVVLIDPRRTMTADIADLHLPVRPDGDVAIFNDLLCCLADRGALDREFIAKHTNGFDCALAAARASDPLAALEDKLSRVALRRFYDLFARTEKTVTVFSQGVNQSSCGTDKVNAIINCHLATGRIGKPGMGPFSVTGQPNAMGGREVGGLANMLAAHMDIENPSHRERVRRFWKSPRIAEKPGLKAVEMFDAITDGRIKALWIMATNPAVSMPDADKVTVALSLCPFVVVSDVVSDTDTLRHAHVKLPAAAWGEKDGTVTNSERRISRQRPFLPAPGLARQDWWMVCEVASRMGYGAAFDYASPWDIFAEHAALSAFENGGRRDFDIDALADIGPDGYDRLTPVQWPIKKCRDDRRRNAVPPPSWGRLGGGEPPTPEGGIPPTPGSSPEQAPAHPTRGRGPVAGVSTVRSPSSRFFGDGRFFTPDGKALFVPIRAAAAPRASGAFPLTLNTGRVRDHWHTMTRTGKSARLSQHLAEPFVEIHPEDAARLRIEDAQLVGLSSMHGVAVARALVTSRQRPGSVFAPMHWSGPFASGGRIAALAPSLTDPISGQPALKNIAVRAERFAARLYGFAVTARKPRAIDADYWALAKCEGGWRIELAFARDGRDWASYAKRLLGAPDEAECAGYLDGVSDTRRFVYCNEGRFLGALFLAPGPVAVSRDWVVAQLGRTRTPSERLALVAGRPGGGEPDRGATVCACFGVGVNDIAAAVSRGCLSVAAVGAATQAGTNCGSCRAEIRTIIQSRQLQAAE